MKPVGITFTPLTPFVPMQDPAEQQDDIRRLEAQHAAGYAKYPVQPDEFDIPEEAQA